MTPGGKHKLKNMSVFGFQQFNIIHSRTTTLENLSYKFESWHPIFFQFHWSEFQSTFPAIGCWDYYCLHWERATSLKFNFGVAIDSYQCKYENPSKNSDAKVKTRKLTKRLELLFLDVFALPKASKIGLVFNISYSIPLPPPSAAKYCIAIFAVSVFPAPLSPLDI